MEHKYRVGQITDDGFEVFEAYDVPVWVGRKRIESRLFGAGPALNGEQHGSKQDCPGLFRWAGYLSDPQVVEGGVSLSGCGLCG